MASWRSTGSTHRRSGNTLVYVLATDDSDGVYIVGSVDGAVDVGGGTVSGTG